MDEQKQRLDLLTNSRLASAKRCLRQHYYKYECGVIRDEEAQALRMGSAMHLGIATWLETRDAGQAIAAVNCQFSAAQPDLETTTILTMLAAYCWRYEHEHDRLRPIVVERQFEAPLVNPASGRASRTWSLAGKMDAIVEIDGNLWVMEHKTTRESIDAASRYWLLLPHDPQVCLYVRAARDAGYDVRGVYYNVIRKPTLRPSQIPVLDDDGLKVVVDEEGARVHLANGKPRQSADKDKGYTLVTRTETDEEYATRLTADILEHPDNYFARREIAVLDNDLDEAARDVWSSAQLLRECQLSGYWHKTVSWSTCPYCPYADICLQGVTLDPASPPAGYRRIDNVHTELEVEH